MNRLGSTNPPGISFFQATHAGHVRTRNEDAVGSSPDMGLWAVADGMGGHDRGDLASQLVISSLLEMAIPANVPQQEKVALVCQTLEDTSQHLLQTAGKISEQAIIGSTVVVLLLGNKELSCLWAGDSRAYRLRGQTLEQMTTDHTVANQLIMEQGLAPHDALQAPGAATLTTAVGAQNFKPELLRKSHKPGDRICLCSDGLNKMVPDSEIESVLNARQGAEAAAQQLLELSLARGAPDNVSIIVVDYG